MVKPQNNKCQKKNIFEVNDFKDICFYYFLHFYNYTKKK